MLWYLLIMIYSALEGFAVVIWEHPLYLVGTIVLLSVRPLSLFANKLMTGG